jgi:hypothetical protein
MLVVEILIFAALLAGIYWIRQRELASLRMQGNYLRRFAEGISVWRGGIGIPADAREAIELLVDTPMHKSVARNLARSMMRREAEPNLENNIFWRAREQLRGEHRESFDWLLRNYFLAMTYSDWLTGPLIRRVWVNGLSKGTQAEIAIETVFSRGMRHAHA